MDVIADCCAGFNSSTESPAQSFLSLSANLEILHNPGDLRLEYQIPYMKFLCDVWLQREQSHGTLVRKDDATQVSARFCRGIVGVAPVRSAAVLPRGMSTTTSDLRPQGNTGRLGAGPGQAVYRPTVGRS